MRELWQKFSNSIQTAWKNLFPWQRIAVVTGSLAVLATVGALIFLISRTEYATLFSNLAEQDAALIVNKLKEDKVEFKLENAGRTILVPKEVVYERRLMFASQGLPNSGIVGYEIFDKNNIGLTDFVQKLNYKRALEGELARTIQSFDEIAAARVHIMIPEPTLFVDDEKPATASVVVNLKFGKKLKPVQVEGIANLVAASVEGLEENNVSVIDSHGKVLSDHNDKNALIELTANQLDVQKRVENYFQEKLASLLAGVVGPNNYIVRVTTDLDFDQVERTMETYDPESSTIRSQETDLQNAQNPANTTGQNTTPRNENTVTNYEISKTVERMVGSVGNIKRISVAVMLNGTYRKTVSPTGEEVTEYLPRSDEEIQKVSELVRNAVGFDARRNDQIQVTNLAFDLSETERNQQLLDTAERDLYWQNILLRSSIAIAALLLIFLVRSIFKKLQSSFSEAESEEVPEMEPLDVPMETQLRLQKRKLAHEIAKERPDDIAKLVKSWLVDLEMKEWNTRN